MKRVPGYQTVDEASWMKNDMRGQWNHVVQRKIWGSGSEKVRRKSLDGSENGDDVPHDVMKRVLGYSNVDEASWTKNDSRNVMRRVPGYLTVDGASWMKNDVRGQ